MLRRSIVRACSLPLALGFAVPASASVVITPIASTSLRTTQVNANTHMAGDNRIFTLSKSGVISVTNPVTNSTTVFNDLSSQVVSNGERGLLGIAFDPNYAANGRYYVFMNTQPVPGGPVYSEVRRYTDTSIGVAAETPHMVMQFDTQGSTNHVGGWIDFDQSGNLLIAVGDGGDGTAPDIRATGQNTSDFFGSVLRVDPNVDEFGADPNNNYGIPAGNLDSPARPEIYAYGVRNPFRNSVAPDGSLIVADVGQVTQEEITIIGPGEPNRNLGWSLREGDMQTPGVGGPIPSDYLAPAYVYDRLSGAAVIGGFVYRGTAVPELYGRYIFGDQVSGDIWSILYNGGLLDETTLEYIGNIASLVSFGETVDGELLATQFLWSGSPMIYSFTSNAVPEPVSWAMMIFGFAMTGMTLRSRRRRPVHAV